MSEILMGRIRTELNPKKYFKELIEQRNIDRVGQVRVGEMVVFALPIDKDYSLSFVGTKPEKYSVEDDVLTIIMTDCCLVYLYNDGVRYKLEVVVAK